MSGDDKDAPELDLDDVLNTEIERKSTDSKGADRPEYADGIDFEGESEPSLGDDALDNVLTVNGQTMREAAAGVEALLSGDPEQVAAQQEPLADLQQLLDYVAEMNGQEPFSVDEFLTGGEESPDEQDREGQEASHDKPNSRQR